MKATKFFEPYFKKGKLNKCSLKTDFEKRAGVYIIKNFENEVLYVGHSTNNLYRTMYRHYQNHRDEQTRHIYGKYKTKVRIFTTTAAQAVRLEKYLIQKLKPRDNENRYEDEKIKPVNIKEVNFWSSGDTFVEDLPF